MFYSIQQTNLDYLNMKKLVTLLLLVCSVVSAYAWKPIFVGHRGSYKGVSNTVEAFRNGVDVYGYTGLECDVRVTSDGYYVICHDETTNSLGGNLTVASATLEQLKDETLTQTRGGTTYTGKICTVEEYLDICVEKNVFPIIELKWTTGINTNDMSNFKGLYTLVQSKNLQDKAIFLTSMYKSLEHIRTNYPTAKCQYLISSFSEDKYDWCKEWNVGPSFAIGAITADLVKRFHQIGLDVACWSVNSAANYLNYGNMGVYMMTCDYLYPNEMVELEDIDWDGSQDEVKPLELECNTKFSYTAAKGNLPTNFPLGGTTYMSAQQMAYQNGKFLVNNYTTSTLLAFDETGNIETPYTGTATHGIAVDDAGNLILRNEAGISETPNLLKVYKAGETNSKDIFFTLLNNGQTNFITASGDIFSEDGGYVYFFPNGQSVVNIVKIAKGEYVETTASSKLSITGSTAGYVIPIDNNPNKFIYQVRGNGYYLYDGVDKGDYVAGNTSTTAPTRNNSIGGAYFTLGGHELFLHSSGTNYNGGFTIRDMTAEKEPILTMAPLGSAAYAGNPSCGAFYHVERIDDNAVYIHQYCMGNGYATYEMKVEGTDVNIKNMLDDKVMVNYVYPNPTDGALTIQSKEDIKTIQVIDLSGSVLMNIAGNGTKTDEINLSALIKGIYFIKINNEKAIKVAKK